MAGSIRYSGCSGTTMALHYTAGSGESSATLHMVNYATGAESTQSLSDGSNSVTVAPGQIYIFIPASYDGDGDLLGLGNFLFLKMPSTGEGNDFTVKWKTDYDADWESVSFNDSETRIRIPTNRRGHWLQWELYGDGQNQRMELRSAGYEARLHGMSYAARQD